MGWNNNEPLTMKGAEQILCGFSQFRQKIKAWPQILKTQINLSCSSCGFQRQEADKIGPHSGWFTTQGLRWQLFKWIIHIVHCGCCFYHSFLQYSVYILEWIGSIMEQSRWHCGQILLESNSWNSQFEILNPRQQLSSSVEQCKHQSAMIQFPVNMDTHWAVTVWWD